MADPGGHQTDFAGAAVFGLPSVAIAARRKAPAAAAKTEKSKGALTLRAIVMVAANDNKSKPPARSRVRAGHLVISL